MDKKIDKRAQKTRKALQGALAVMLDEKVLRKITVQEVADLADVNRVTFYKHYKDIKIYMIKWKKRCFRISVC